MIHRKNIIEFCVRRLKRCRVRGDPREFTIISIYCQRGLQFKLLFVLLSGNRISDGRSCFIMLCKLREFSLRSAHLAFSWVLYLVDISSKCLFWRSCRFWYLLWFFWIFLCKNFHKFNDKSGSLWGLEIFLWLVHNMLECLVRSSVHSIMGRWSASAFVKL